MTPSSRYFELFQQKSVSFWGPILTMSRLSGTHVFWRTLGKQKNLSMVARGTSAFQLLGTTFSRPVIFWMDEEGTGHSPPVLLSSQIGLFSLIK